MQVIANTLASAVEAYVEAGIAPATRRAYRTDLDHLQIAVVPDGGRTQPLAVEPERSGEGSTPIGLKASEPVRIGRLVSVSLFTMPASKRGRLRDRVAAAPCPTSS